MAKAKRKGGGSLILDSELEGWFIGYYTEGRVGGGGITFLVRMYC